MRAAARSSRTCPSSRWQCRKTLRVVAEWGDGWNTSGSIEEVSDALETLQRHCDDVGRDISTIETTVSFPVILRDDPGSADARIRELLAHNGVSEEDFEAISPASRQIADELRRYLALGFETVIVRMPAPYDRQTIERMREVADLLVD